MGIDTIKLAMWITIISLVLGALGAVGNHLVDSGYNKAMLEVAQRQAKRDAANARRIMSIQNQNNSEPKTNTVYETIEKVKHVDRYIESYVYVCNDLGDDFVRVRNDTRECIYKGGSIGDCLE